MDTQLNFYTGTSFDMDRYATLVENSDEYLAFQSQPENYAAARALSVKILHAAYECLPASGAMLLNSSTGKDSTLMCALAIQVLEQRKAAGLPLHTTTVAISDTASEFPEMALRMREEQQAINRHASKLGLPLSCKIVGPRPKDRLLVEVLGNGKPLPKISTGQSKSGYNAATWCMERVKRGPLEMIVAETKADNPIFVQSIGVRSAESASRAAKISRYAADLPYGLTALGDKRERIGLTPIAHWQDSMLMQWMRQEMAPWDIFSLDKLAQIYAKGSANGITTNECVLSIGKDNQVSNTCSDLGGTRFGCWMCLLSKNRSLENTARRDPRYRWLKLFHNQLYRHHEINNDRVKLRDDSGFTGQNLFPKTFTFRERYRLLTFLFRAELESGFQLLQPEDIAAIQVYWQKAGVHAITPQDAKQDAVQWKATGKIQLLPDTLAKFAVSTTLTTGMPAGAYFHLLHNGFRPLDATHMLAFHDAEMAIFPTLQAHLFRDLARPDDTLVLITDTPSVIGTTTNTGLINGIQTLAWEYVGTRPTTSWEREMSAGRSFFYQSSLSSMQRACEQTRNQEITPLTATYLENLELAATGGLPDDPLAMDYKLHQGDSAIIGKLSEQDFGTWRSLIARLADVSDTLEYTAAQMKEQLLEIAGDRLEMLQTLTPAGQSPEAEALRKTIKKEVKQSRFLEENLPLALEMLNGLKELATALQKGRISIGLINDLAYLARTERYDQEYAGELLGRLHTRLQMTKTLAA